MEIGLQKLRGVRNHWYESQMGPYIDDLTCWKRQHSDDHDLGRHQRRRRTRRIERTVDNPVRDVQTAYAQSILEGIQRQQAISAPNVSKVAENYELLWARHDSLVSGQIPVSRKQPGHFPGPPHGIV